MIQCKKLYWLEYLLIFSCISFLRDTDSYYPVYIVVGVFGCIALYANIIRETSDTGDKCSHIDRVLLIGFASVFTVMVILSNYFLFEELTYYDGASTWFSHLYKCSLFIVVTSGCFLIFYHILFFLRDSLRNCTWKTMRSVGSKSPSFVFATSFWVICGIDVIIMISCRFPGIFNGDSVYQMQQALSGSYTNHHPFYHTILIKLFLVIGQAAFHDMTMGIALHSLFQICSMALIFAFAVVTIYQVGLSKRWVWLLLGCYALLPIHIAYSFAMWKDVLFGGATLLFSIALFRILYDVGKYPFINYATLIFGGVGSCLWRSNGFFAVIISVVGFILLFGKTQKRVILFLIGILMVSYVLKHPALTALDIKQPDTVEMLSIPIQQVAEVVVNCGDDLADNQRDLLENIVDIEEVKSAYEPGYSDPMKKLLRKEGKQEYFVAHKEDYARLYVQLGFAHPKEYLFGWVKQTKGYWNGGYKQFIDWSRRGSENGWGVQVNSSNEAVNELWEGYGWCFGTIPLLRILLCIGLNVWILIAMVYLSLTCRNKGMLALLILPLAVILSLLISTPVDAMYRYAYAVFCCVPFLVCCNFTNKMVL